MLLLCGASSIRLLIHYSASALSN